MTSTTRRSIAHRSRAAWTRSDVVVTGDNPADPLLLGDLAGFLDGGALGGTQRVLDAFNALPFAERCLRALSGDIARRFHLLHAVNITVRRPCRAAHEFCATMATPPRVKASRPCGAMGNTAFTPATDNAASRLTQAPPVARNRRRSESHSVRGNLLTTNFAVRRSQAPVFAAAPTAPTPTRSGRRWSGR